MHVDLLSRPALTSSAAIAAALDRLAAQGSPAETWRALTECFTIDLDAAAAILPDAEPEPRWLPHRG